MTTTTATNRLVVRRTPSPDDETAWLIALIASDRTEEGWSAEATTDCIVDLLSYIRHLAYDQPPAAPLRVAVVVEVSADARPESRAFRSALAEAVRGICHGLAREIGPDLRINTVLCEKAGDDALAATFEFLASTRSNFVTGATIDVRSSDGVTVR